MVNRTGPLVSIRLFKLFVERSLPQESALSKVLLTEKDELTPKAFSSKCEAWLEFIDLLPANHHPVPRKEAFGQLEQFKLSQEVKPKASSI